MSPDLEVFLVIIFPLIGVAKSPKVNKFHSLGISPNLESSNESGNKSLISFDSPVDLSSAFALTGSKSINQDL